MIAKDSGKPFAGTLAQSQRVWAALDSRPRSPPPWRGNRARSSSRRPAQGQPESSAENLRTSLNEFKGTEHKDVEDQKS